MDLILRRRRENARIQRKVFRDRENPFQCDDNTFFVRYRFTKTTAMFIIEELSIYLERPTKRSKAFPPHLIVLTSLNILGTGNFQFVSGQILYHGLGQSAVSKIFKEFLSALILQTKNHIKFPRNEVEMTKVKRGFYSTNGFPNVIGAIDGTHIAIQKPPVWDAYTFFNRKSYYSINIQAVCDSNAIFTDVVVRWPGSTHDTHIYKSSLLYNFLHSEEFPENAWLLGDSGYPLEHCLLTPIIHPSTSGEENYNKFHKRTRKIIEQAFGILKSRFRIISKSGGMLCYSLEKCVNISLCCFILHNIAKTRNEPNLDDDIHDSGADTDEDEDDDDRNYEEEDQSTSGIRGQRNRNILVNSFQNQ